MDPPHTHKMSRLSDGLDLVSTIERERENEDKIFSLGDGRKMKLLMVMVKFRKGDYWYQMIN